MSCLLPDFAEIPLTMNIADFKLPMRKMRAYFQTEKGVYLFLDNIGYFVGGFTIEPMIRGYRVNWYA